MYSLLSEERVRADDAFEAFKTDIFKYVFAEVDKLRDEVAELNSRIELLTPANVIRAAQQDEPLQVPIKMSRSVDWRTKRAELEKKYSKGGVRENLVKEIASPADIFQDK